MLAGLFRLGEVLIIKDALSWCFFVGTSRPTPTDVFWKLTWHYFLEDSLDKIARSGRIEDFHHRMYIDIFGRVE